LVGEGGTLTHRAMVVGEHVLGSKRGGARGAFRIPGARLNVGLSVCFCCSAYGPPKRVRACGRPWGPPRPWVGPPEWTHLGGAEGGGAFPPLRILFRPGAFFGGTCPTFSKTGAPGFLFWALLGIKDACLGFSNIPPGRAGGGAKTGSGSLIGGGGNHGAHSRGFVFRGGALPFYRHRGAAGGHFSRGRAHVPGLIRVDLEALWEFQLTLGPLQAIGAGGPGLWRKTFRAGRPGKTPLTWHFADGKKSGRFLFLAPPPPGSGFHIFCPSSRGGTPGAPFADMGAGLHEEHKNSGWGLRDGGPLVFRVLG